jgi:hypothetical protein
VTNFTAVPVIDTAYGHIAKNEAFRTEAVSGITDTEAIVRAYFSDIPVMIHIARCESTFRHTLSDGSILSGKVNPADTGVMQINSRYHGEKAEELGFDLNNLYDNMAYARNLYERQGTKPWRSSAPCWSWILAMR